ncbi:MAG: hypothetical protein ACXAC7_10645, partial [Candidatus Hodarchaeales archaeon]
MPEQKISSSKELIAYTNSSYVIKGNPICFFIGVLDESYNFMIGINIVIYHLESGMTKTLYTTNNLKSLSIATDSISNGIQEFIFVSDTSQMIIKVVITDKIDNGRDNVDIYGVDFSAVRVGESFGLNYRISSYGASFFNIYAGNYVSVFYHYQGVNLLLNTSFVPSGFYVPYFESIINFFLPLWITPGIYDEIVFCFGNSSIYQTTTATFNISILESPWDLTYTYSTPIEEPAFNRLSFGETPRDYITLTLSQGIELTDVSLSIWMITNETEYLLSTQQVITHTFDIYLDVNIFIPLGEGTLILEFSRNNKIVEKIERSVIIYDLIEISFQFEEEIEQGKINRFEIITLLEDTYQPISAHVIITDTLTSNVLLDVVTSETGYLVGEIYFEENITAGARFFEVNVTPAEFSEHYRGRILSFYQTFYVHTMINLIDPIGQVNRGEITPIKAQVVTTDNLPVNEGILSLKLMGNILTSCNASILCNYDFTVTSDIPLGEQSIVWSYTGSNTYREAILEHQFMVFGHPSFQNIQYNSSHLTVSETILVEGKLLMENDQPVISNIPVQLWKIRETTGVETIETLMDIVLLEDSVFFFPIFPNPDDIGNVIYELRFDGDLLNYYLPAVNYRIDLSQSPERELIIPEFLETNTIVSFEVSGRVFGHYSIAYCHPIENQCEGFNDLSEFYLNDTGQTTVDIYVPSKKGKVT